MYFISMQYQLCSKSIQQSNSIQFKPVQFHSFHFNSFQSNPIQPSPIQSNPIRPVQVDSSQINSIQVSSNRVNSMQVDLPDHINSIHVNSIPIQYNTIFLAPNSPPPISLNLFSTLQSKSIPPSPIQFNIIQRNWVHACSSRVKPSQGNASQVKSNLFNPI